MPDLNILIGNQLDQVATETTTTLQGLVSNMKANGMSDKEIKSVLMNDLTGNGRIFGGYRNQVKNTVKSGIGASANNASMKSFEAAGVKEYRWVAVGDKNVCADCLPRNGEVADMEFWKAVGLPQSGFSICRYNCRCQLVPSDYKGEDIKEPILKRDPDLDIPSNLSELGAAIKVNKSTLEGYSDIISNIVTDPRYSKADKIKMLKSAFLGNKSLSKLGTTSRELIYRYTNKQYNPKNFKASTLKEAKIKNKSVNLSDVEKKSMATYTGSGYSYINQYLRGLTDRVPKKWNELSQGLESALSKLVTWDATSWRGVRLLNITASNEFMKDWGGYKVGDIWRPKGFTSSSARQRMAESWAKFDINKVDKKNVLITMEGKNGKYVDRFSSHTGEDEVLFKPNSRFKILRADVKHRVNSVNDAPVLEKSLEEFNEYYNSLSQSERININYQISIVVKELN